MTPNTQHFSSIKEPFLLASTVQKPFFFTLLACITLTSTKKGHSIILGLYYATTNKSLHLGYSKKYMEQKETKSSYIYRDDQFQYRQSRQ